MIEYKKPIPTRAVNPVISGFHPDPSVCGANGAFYVVNSSFAYFPGIPVFKSRDLRAFEQIGNALDRAEQLSLKGCAASEGVFAPTIRFYNGVFYIVSTCVPRGGNFIITASDPAGPWSKPVFLDAEGIDPSLFFDDDGVCWFTGTRPAKNAAYFGDNEIFLRRLDINALALTGETYSLWRGAFRRAVWPEGPHIYKKDGFYYLLTAEGGTERHHSVVVARSKEITGAYEGDPDNPILTHRHLGKSASVVNVGHGDMVSAENGEWYMLALGSRPVNGHTLLGRETFLARVEWQDGWPVVNPGAGTLQSEVELPFAPASAAKTPERYTFSQGLPPEFVSLRELSPCALSPGGIELLPTETPSYIALRLESYSERIRARLAVLDAENGGEAGLMLLQSDDFSLRLTLFDCGGAFAARAVKREGEKEEAVLFQAEAAQSAELEIRLNGLRAELSVDDKYLGSVDLTFLSTESAGGFTGCTAGMYERRCRARFEWLDKQTAQAGGAGRERVL